MDVPQLYSKYEKMLEKGAYDSVEELCNNLGLNYDDVYDYESYSDSLSEDGEDDMV